MSDGYGAALNTINNNLSTVNDNLLRIGGQINGMYEDVNQIQGSVNDLDIRLEALMNEFRVFVQTDLKQKELQLAETRLVKVRQEIKDTYGYYDEARRMAVGILQASDISLVRQDVVNNCTEELMLQTPRYWLAPCLIALAAWLNDNRDLAERALQEAIRRNDERTSLFFALVSRRASRFDATERWLERYLSIQDPTALERDMVVVLDAFACGLFGSDSSGVCSRRLQEWVGELSNRAGFVESQRQQWVEAFKSKMVALDNQDFPYLRKYSPTWPQMQKAMESAHLHKILKDHFTSVLSGDVSPSQSLAQKLDEILDKLVTNFDTEELPLRRDERLFSLIVECDGDRGLAQQKMTAEKSLDEYVSFTQLLTNAAMQPETTGASLATQRLSVALSKDWIESGYQDLTAQIRSAVPTDIELSINDWTGVTRNGENEQSLLETMQAFIAEWYQNASEKYQFGQSQYAVLAAIGAIALITVVNSAWMFFLFALVGAAGYYFYAQDSLKKQRAHLDQTYAEMQQNMPLILKAVLAEVVDWRRQWTAADGVGADVKLMLDQISPAQFVSSSFSKARVVLAK